MDKLLKLLSEVNDSVDFENETKLVDDGLIDSFDIIQIISSIDDEYDISIPATEILPENFNSAKALLALIEKLENED
ncbi:MAG: acyl carrier protein [Treponema sp. CETP13]|nr:MAG: acyl carrier protein [Treponema sp. CETP13]